MQEKKCLEFDIKTETCKLNGYICGFRHQKKCRNYNDSLEDLMLEPNLK